MAIYKGIAGEEIVDTTSIWQIVLCVLTVSRRFYGDGQINCLFCLRKDTTVQLGINYDQDIQWVPRFPEKWFKVFGLKHTPIISPQVDFKGENVFAQNHIWPMNSQ